MNTAHEEEKFLPKELPEELPAHASPPNREYEKPKHHANQNKNENIQINETIIEDPYDNYTEVKTLLSWHAPGRPYKKRSRDYFLTALLITLFVEVILFLFAQYLLMAVVVSFIFLTFALAIVPPHDFHYKISTEGIKVEDHFFLWQELYDFYFKKIHGVDVLLLRTKAFLPGELTITLGDMDKNHIKQVLLPYLPYREFVKPTFMEKSGDWLSKNFPLERHTN